MTQIRIFKGTSERSLVDQVSKVMDAIFNETDMNDRMMNGVYLLPPRPLHEIIQAMHPEINYLCDEILETDHKVPQIYQWREWGYKANQLISALDLLGLQIIERPKEEENV